MKTSSHMLCSHQRLGSKHISLSAWLFIFVVGCHPYLTPTQTDSQAEEIHSSERKKKINSGRCASAFCLQHSCHTKIEESPPPNAEAQLLLQLLPVSAICSRWDNRATVEPTLCLVWIMHSLIVIIAIMKNVNSKMNIQISNKEEQAEQQSMKGAVNPKNQNSMFYLTCSSMYPSRCSIATGCVVLQ